MSDLGSSEGSSQRLQVSPLRLVARLIERGTPFPLPAPVRIDLRVHNPPAEHALVAALLPMVGALVGAISYAATWAALRVWPVAIAAVLGFAVLSLVHVYDLDGLVDCCDAMPLARKREDVLRILKDPAMGAFGGTALVLLVGAQLAAVVCVPQGRLLGALFVTAVVSRWAQLLVMMRARPAHEKSTTKPLIDNLGWTQLLFATVTTAAITCAIVSPLRATAIVVGSTGIALLGRRLCVARLGGIVGDMVGAVSCFVSLWVLLVIAARGPV